MTRPPNGVTHPARPVEHVTPVALACALTLLFRGTAWSGPSPAEAARVTCEWRPD